MTDKAKEKQLTPREAKAVEGIVNGKTQEQALLDAGYADGYSRTGSTSFLERPRIQSAIASAMHEAGLSAPKLVKVLSEGLSANKVSYFQKDGIVTDVREDVDHVTRHKFLDTALTLGGHYPSKETTQVTESYEARIFRLRGVEPA